MVGNLHTTENKTQTVFPNQHKKSTLSKSTMTRTLRSGSSYTGWSSSSYGRSGRWQNSNRNKRTADRRETRSKKKRFSHLNSDSSSTEDSNPTIPSSGRITQTSTIRCTNYGRRHEDIYPNHFFCSPCKNWEILIDTGTIGKQKIYIFPLQHTNGPMATIAFSCELKNGNSLKLGESNPRDGGCIIVDYIELER